MRSQRQPWSTAVNLITDNEGDPVHVHDSITASDCRHRQARRICGRNEFRFQGFALHWRYMGGTTPLWASLRTCAVAELKLFPCECTAAGEGYSQPFNTSTLSSLDGSRASIGQRIRAAMDHIYACPSVDLLPEAEGDGGAVCI